MRASLSSSRARLGVVILAGLAIVAVALFAFRPSGSSKPEAAPTFDVPDLRDPGKRITLAAYRGKPVIVNFWASWCAPCKEELPAFQAVHAELGNRVAFLGVNHQDARSSAIELFDQLGVKYPSGYDPEGKVAPRYRLFGMPSTIFVSRDGKVLERRTGALSKAELRAIIHRLFPEV